MDTRAFENIKAKIETLKQKKAKAEGSIESILAEWKRAYGFSTIEEAEKHITELDEEIEVYESKLKAIYDELNGLTNWNLV